MCRILAVKGKQKIKPNELLRKFTDMAEASRTLDDDRQEDGWGIAWLNDRSEWEVYKSLNAIWNDSEIAKFQKFPSAEIFLVHARSATYKSQLGEVSYNQPYANERYSFAFNGYLEGVRIDRPTRGRIGAEKIWHLTQEYLHQGNTSQALLKLGNDMEKFSQKIHGMNIVVSDKSSICGLCKFTPNRVNPEYYTLQLHKGQDLGFICSGKLDGYKSRDFQNGEILTLT